MPDGKGGDTIVSQGPRVKAVIVWGSVRWAFSPMTGRLVYTGSLIDQAHDVSHWLGTSYTREAALLSVVLLCQCRMLQHIVIVHQANLFTVNAWSCWLLYAFAVATPGYCRHGGCSTCCRLCCLP
jgi:hypothetical protein